MFDLEEVVEEASDWNDKFVEENVDAVVSRLATEGLVSFLDLDSFLGALELSEDDEGLLFM